MNNPSFGFGLLTSILDSKYPERIRYSMAVKVVQLLWNEIDTHPPKCFYRTWVPPLLDFLSLSEKFPLPSPGFTALQILLCRQTDYDADVGATLLPILASTLSRNHPLQSRALAVEIFHRFMPGWFFQQMEGVSGKNLDKLLGAIGDPFQHHLPGYAADDGPLLATVVLIEFASSDLWRNHLDRSNFDSCEEILTMGTGRRAILKCMLATATYTWSTFLRTPAKIAAAVKRLEELQCLNTAEMVILWAWSTGVIDAVDHDAWRSIGRVTLEFYHTHGMGRLTTLKRQLVDINRITEGDHLELLRGVDGGGSPCRAKGARHRGTVTKERNRIDLRISRVCQLRRLYHLFGSDPATWEEAVAVEEMDEGMDE